jgi:hypothetical protein
MAKATSTAVYECGFKFMIEEGSMVPVSIRARTPFEAAERFAGYSHKYMGTWEYGAYWDGDKAVAVRRQGEEVFIAFNIERRVVPEFIATAA